MTSQGPGEPFRLGEKFYGYQACSCSGKCYIDYDTQNDEEYLKVSADGDRAVFRYLSIEKLPERIEISGTGRADIDIYLNHVHVGGGEVSEENSFFFLDCSRIRGTQAEVELVFRQVKGFIFRNMMFI